MKAFAEREGLEHYSHRLLKEVASKMISEAHDEKLLTDWSFRLRLHANSYEGFMTEEEVRITVKNASSFFKSVVNLLKKASYRLTMPSINGKKIKK